MFRETKGVHVTRLRSDPKNKAVIQTVASVKTRTSGRDDAQYTLSLHLLVS